MDTGAGLLILSSTLTTLPVSAAATALHNMMCIVLVYLPVYFLISDLPSITSYVYPKVECAVGHLQRVM